MSMFPSSAIGLPQSLKYDLPPSLSDSARSYSVSVAPDGVTSVALPAMTATAFVANSTGNFGNMLSQIVSFTIPSGMSDSVFMDPNCTTLSFTLTYQVTTASAGITGGSINLIGGAHAFWDSLVLYSNNMPVETVNGYGLLANFLLNNTVNYSERTGGLGVCCGVDSNSANGIEIGHAAIANYRYNFTIPLISVLGVNTDKMIPIGSLNNLQLQMTTANLYPFVSYCTAVAAPGTGIQPVFANMLLSEFSLNLKYIDVGDYASAMLRQTLQDGKWLIKSSTYTNSAVTLPSGTSGAQQLLLQIRNSSVKSVYHQFGIAQSQLAPNSYYDCFNICTTTRQLQTGSGYWPNKPINDCQRPSEGYMYLIQAMGGSIPKALGTVVFRENYNVCITTVPPGSDSAMVVCVNSLRQTPAGGDTTWNQISKWPNMAYYGYDLEKSAGVLFSGINTRASPPFLNLTIASGSPTPQTVICNAWGYSDLVLVIDTVSKSIQAFI
jgi:hypothetical protein